MSTCIRFRGIVQGVGFRPAVYRAATSLGIEGTVANNISGVEVVVRGDESEAARLVERLRGDLPPVARIDSVEISAHSREIEVSGFHILPSSRSGGMAVAKVSPDIAICPDCLEDMRSGLRRKDYFLTNCTNCGPRFTIVTALPYDRAATTMAQYPLCGHCAAEYDNPADRRFHAQPVACHSCGPAYEMILPDGCRFSDPGKIAGEAAALIDAGQIVMVKGLGGYNLMASAACDHAVAMLRELKRRPRKPFAVMVRSVEAAERIADISPDEATLLSSRRAPIVVCAAAGGSSLSAATAPGCSSIGVMLPYMGFQHAMFERLDSPAVVVTSANRTGEPMIVDDDEARRYAADYSLPLVWHPRAIANRCDDSVARIVDGTPALLRRARGFVPEGIAVSADVEGVVGMGADITSAWALGSGGEIVLSPYLGSITGAERVDVLRQSVESIGELYQVEPQIIVVDAHPGYHSSAYGRSYAECHGAVVAPMWHHHAHAVSVMAEYGVENEVVAIVLDGTGAGPDSTIWGAELLRCTRSSFGRLDHGTYLPLPGGDKAAKEPWRMAAALLFAIYGSVNRLPGYLVDAVGVESVRILEQMMRRGLNCPQGCGAGRVWDAVAALLGLAYTNGYEAEAPILLENAARPHAPQPAYPVSPGDELNLKPMVDNILADIALGEDPGVIAARFHATYAAAWAQVALRQARRLNIRTIVLAGGVMQNALLSTLIAGPLRASGLTVLAPLRVPAGDGGIAVGQVAYGAELKRKHHA